VRVPYLFFIIVLLLTKTQAQRPVSIHFGLGRYVTDIYPKQLVTIRSPLHTITSKANLSNTFNFFPLFILQKSFNSSFIDFGYGMEFARINLETKVYLPGKTVSYSSFVNFFRHRFPVSISTKVYAYNNKRQASLYVTLGCEIGFKKKLLNRDYNRIMDISTLTNSKDGVTLTETIFDFNGRTLRFNSGLTFTLNKILKRTIGLKVIYSLSRPSVMVIYSHIDANNGTSATGQRFNNSGIYLHLIVPLCKDP